MRMEISHATWGLVSKLLDEALDLAPAERVAWLERQRGTQPERAALLGRLLAAHATSESADLLAQLPVLREVDEAAERGLAPGERIGPYRLKRELGAGGMADVWLAERADGAFERAVALKLPRINRLRRDLRVRFERERDILARLEHPHIARLYDAGIAADGLPYLAMEYIDGEPIGAYCDARRLDVAARVRLFARVLDAVQFAHSSLVIHRDLKPSNILVTQDGEVRLLDFGIAKLLADDARALETQLTQISGRTLTPDYASPEQIRGEPLTIASDVYSLGVVLYELLAGQRPYRLKLASAAQLEEAIVSADAAKPSAAVATDAAHARSTTPRRLARVLAGDLDTIVLKALAKAPAQRYATVAEFAADLRRHLDGEPVRARPASWRYRARKFIARNRLAVGTAVAVGAALIGAASVSFRQAQLAREQARLAREQATRADEVKNFVLSILRASDADRAGGRQTSAVDLLLQAHQRVDAAALGDDRIRAELQATIGNALFGLGEHRAAASVLARAVPLSSAAWGERHRITADARIQYGFALANLGQAKLAAEQFDAAERVLRGTGDPVLLANALRGQSVLASNAGDLEHAVALADEAVRAAERGDDKIELIASCMRLSSLRVSLARAGALEPARRAEALVRELHGERPTVLLLEARTTYFAALAAEGSAADALAGMTETLEQQVAMLDADNFQVAITLGRLGTVAWRLGDTFASIERFREALRIFTKLSPDKPTASLAITRARLGNMLDNIHRDDEALAEWREAGRMYSALYGAEHPGTRAARIGSASALTRLGRLDEADALFTALRATPPRSVAEQGLIERRLALLRSAQGRHVEALALLHEAQPALADVRLELPRALSPAELGSALLAGDRAAEALDVLLKARQRLHEAQPRGSPDLADTALGIAQVRIALGEPGAAAAAAGEAAEFWRRFDGHRREQGVALLWLARAGAAAGDAEQASRALRSADALLSAAGRPAEHSMLERTRRELAAAKR